MVENGEAKWESEGVVRVKHSSHEASRKRRDWLCSYKRALPTCSARGRTWAGDSPFLGPVWGRCFMHGEFPSPAVPVLLCSRLWFCHGPGSLSQLPPPAWDTNTSSVFWLQQNKAGLHLPYISFFMFCQLSWTFLTHELQDLKENLTFQF